MPSTLIFDCLEFKRRSCEIPFPKSIVYSVVVLDKLGQSQKIIFSSENAES